MDFNILWLRQNSNKVSGNKQNSCSYRSLEADLHLPIGSTQTILRFKKYLEAVAADRLPYKLLLDVFWY